MADIVLAFLIGVLCGMGYMYLRYCNIMKGHLRELEELRLNQARIRGQMHILNMINGIKEDEENGVQ